MQNGQTITWMDRDAAPVAEWSTPNGGVDVYDEHGKLVPAYKRVLIDGDAAVAPAPATFKSLPSTCIYASACATSSIPEPAPTGPRYIFVPIPNQPIAPPSPVQQQLPPPPPPQQPPLPPPAPQPLVVPAAAVLHHPPPASNGNWSHHTTYDQEYGNGKARVSSFKKCPPESLEDMEFLEYREEEEFINRIKSYCETNQFHHTFAFTDNNAATLRVLRPYIPRFLTHPDWPNKIYASSIDEQCFGDLKKKVDDYVYLITISIAKEHVAPWKQMSTALFRRCIEQNEFGQLVLYALIFLDSLETRIRDAEDGSEVLIGHYVGMSAAAINAHSRSYDHFNNATPASLLKLILFTIELTNQMLESRQVDYQIKARKTILTSVADLDCTRYGTDVVGVLEVVVSMLTDSAIGLPGGMNVAACGMMMNLPQPLTIINQLPHYATIDSLMQLDINSTILPLIPYSIAVLIGSVVFKLKGKFNVDLFNTVGDLVTFAKNNPDAFKKHSKEVSGAGTKDKVVPRRKSVGLTRIDSVDYLSDIQVRTFDRSQFGRSLSAEDHLLNSLIQPDRHAPVGSRLHSLKLRYTNKLNPQAHHIYSCHVEGDWRIIGTPRTFKELENSVQAFTVMIRSKNPRQEVNLHLNATCDRDHPEGGAGLCCVIVAAAVVNARVDARTRPEKTPCQQWCVDMEEENDLPYWQIRSRS